MSCRHCRDVGATLTADLVTLRARVLLPAPREALYDGEEVGRALERGAAITERERAHVEGEIAALEHALSLLVPPEYMTISYLCHDCGDHSAQRITMHKARANDARACELCGAAMDITDTRGPWTP